MRHRIGSRKLNRTTSHRLAMLGNMVASLIEHEAIHTTLPKAKEARRIAERIITLGKRGGLAKVFDDLSDRYAERAGGYTRIVHLGHRWGDAAPMALLELLDRPQEEKKAATKPKGKAKEAEGGKAQPKKG